MTGRLVREGVDLLLQVQTHVIDGIALLPLSLGNSFHGHFILIIEA